MTTTLADVFGFPMCGDGNETMHLTSVCLSAGAQDMMQTAAGFAPRAFVRCGDDIFPRHLPHLQADLRLDEARRGILRLASLFDDDDDDATERELKALASQVQIADIVLAGESLERHAGLEVPWHLVAQIARAQGDRAIRWLEFSEARIGFELADALLTWGVLDDTSRERLIVGFARSSNEAVSSLAYKRAFELSPRARKTVFTTLGRYAPDAELREVAHALSSRGQ